MSFFIRPIILVFFKLGTCATRISRELKELRLSNTRLNMSSWGSGVQGATKTIAKKGATKPAAAPAMSKPLGLVTMIEDINKKALTFGNVESGHQGDKFVKIFLDNERITLGVCKLPTFTRIPFKAGPYTNSEGKNLNESWNMSVDITPAQCTEYLEFEEKMKRELYSKCDELLPPKAGAKKGMSKESFEEKFNSLIKPANAEKGYPATIRVSVQHEAEDKNGRKNTMPLIQTCDLTDDNKITKRVTATVDNLDEKSAVVPVCNVVRGVYGGGTGWGLKLTLVNCTILKNKGGDTQIGPDLSGVEELDETAEEMSNGTKNGPEVSTEETDQFVNDSNTPVGF